MTQFSPDRGEILGIQTGLKGWVDVQGLGPSYFLSPAAEQDLRTFLSTGTASSLLLDALSAGRARVVNFFGMLSGDADFNPAPASSFAADTALFLKQLGEQARIWKSGSFKSLDFSNREVELLAAISVKSSPCLFFMGFVDAIPHSSQVARLCATMAHTLNGRHSEVFQAAVVGKLHDPKFEARIDVAKQNLATHPINAVALANAIFEDRAVLNALVDYFHGNQQQAGDFVEGVLDALGVNNDSWFVQMVFIFPQFVKRIGEKYGAPVADGFKAVMEGRLESASKGTAPPSLPPHLHGCLAQEFLDSGLRGISQHGWQLALSESGIVHTDPIALFQQLVNGSLGEVTQAQITKLRASLRTNANSVLKVQISATRMLHHHQEVVPSGRIAAAALVIADPMMLSPHKVAAVYSTPIMDRLRSYCQSFDDNVRLLPGCASTIGRQWQRAVYASMLWASDCLTGGGQLAVFAASHGTTTLQKDIDDLRAFVLTEQAWGAWAKASGAAAVNAEVQQVLQALETAYVAVVNQYREAAYGSAQNLEKFIPRL